MPECLYLVDAGKSPTFPKWSTEISVYPDKVKISRRGKTVLPREFEISFDDITAITTGGPVWSNSWITFSVPGVEKVHQNAVMLGKPNRSGQIAYTGDARPLMDPCSVVYEKGMQEKVAEDYKAINKIYSQYKAAVREKQMPGGSVVVQESALDQLKKLKELYDMGAINESEYTEKREKLLQGI